MKLDTAGIIQWDYTYNITSSNGEMGKNLLTDGTDLYIVGASNVSSGEKNTIILKMDKNGVFKKGVSYGKTTADEWMPIGVSTPTYCDSSYIYVSAERIASGNSDVLLVKLDTALTTTCDYSPITCTRTTSPNFSAALSYNQNTENLVVSNDIMHTPHTFNEATCSGITDLYDTLDLETTTLLDAGFTGATSYIWPSGATSSSISISSSGTYTCVVVVGCCSFTHTFIVTTCSDTPPVLNITQTGQCSGEIFNLHVSGADSYTWQNGGNTYSGPDLSLIIDNTTSFVVTGFGPDGCSTILNYTVSPVILSPVTLTYTGNLCSNQIASFNLSGPSSYTYMLTDGFGTYTSFPFNYMLTDTVTFYVTVHDTSGCTYDTSYFIPVEQVNTSLDFGISDFTPCLGDSVTLTISNPGTFTWFDGTINIPGNTVSFTADSTVNYYLTGISSTGCELADTMITIRPYTIPNVDLTFESLPSACIEKNYSFHTIGSALSYSWSIDSIQVSTGSSFNAMLTPGYHLISLTVDNNGCASITDTLIYNDSTIVVPQKAFIPNIFTPNGDGMNDFFKVTITDVSDFSIAIFDRWGIEVYQSNDPYFKWNGLFKNGKIVPGMYLYLIRYSSACLPNMGISEIKGWLSLSE
jgi:gliding motility-associated-like protein